MASSGGERHDKNWRLLCDSLHQPPPVPTLPFDVIPEILCRLPVKFILQFRCVCKSWNSLICDPNFIKKQLHVSTTQNLHFLYYANDSGKYSLTSYPVESVFTNITSNFTQFEYFTKYYRLIGSCNGIVCIADDDKGLVILWNPSTRKFKEMPLFEKPKLFIWTLTTFGFGYDSSNDNYKVVVLHYDMYYSGDKDNWLKETEVKVHTLGTNIWRTIQQYPFCGVPVPLMEGKFVSGTINWLFSAELNWECQRFIVSFDLAKESYQKISPPNFGGVDVCDLSALAVFRDCLCVTTYGNDVWIMKEYGNKESWTKLFTVSYMRDPSNYRVYVEPVYIFEDDQMLLKFFGNKESTLVLYDPRSNTLKDTNLENNPEVYGESLISPCSLC